MEASVTETASWIEDTNPNAQDSTPQQNTDSSLETLSTASTHVPDFPVVATAGHDDPEMLSKSSAFQCGTCSKIFRRVCDLRYVVPTWQSRNFEQVRQKLIVVAVCTRNAIPSPTSAALNLAAEALRQTETAIDMSRLTIRQSNTSVLLLVAFSKQADRTAGPDI